MEISKESVDKIGRLLKDPDEMCRLIEKNVLKDLDCASVPCGVCALKTLYWLLTDDGKESVDWAAHIGEQIEVLLADDGEWHEAQLAAYLPESEWQIYVYWSDYTKDFCEMEKATRLLAFTAEEARVKD